MGVQEERAWAGVQEERARVGEQPEEERAWVDGCMGWEERIEGHLGVPVATPILLPPNQPTPCISAPPPPSADSHPSILSSHLTPTA